MSLVLQIETATFNGSVALSKDGATIDRLWLGEGEKHIKTLAPKVRELLTKNSCVTSDITAVAVSEGPGSYTGLRIGVSFAKGLCQALQLPLVSIPTLSIIGAAIFDKHPNIEKAVPLLDARRMEVYTTEMNKGGACSPVKPMIITEESFSSLTNNKVVFAGNGTAKTAEVLGNSNWVFDTEIQLDAVNMTSMVHDKYCRSEFEDLMNFQPFYLKEFMVGAPSKKIMNILNS